MAKTFRGKICGEYLDAIASGKRTFDLRLDAGQNPGDVLILMEWDGTQYTGRWVKCKITYVLRDCAECGLNPHYCVMGINVLFADLDSFSDLEERYGFGD